MPTTLPPPTRSSESPVVKPDCSDADTLAAFLGAYWLRPENAVWMTLRSLALRQAGFGRYDADICCGDGVFSFLHAGGRFDESFDVFSAVDQLERVTQQHADMFDCAARQYAPPIAKRPAARIALGADLKPNLLAKSAALGVYERLIEQDGNCPLRMPDESIDSIYCNSAYWIAGIDAFLCELGRVVRTRGRIVLHVKLTAMRDYTLEGFRPVLGDRVLDIIGRGRLDCWPTVGTRSQWERRFNAAGLRIENAAPLATRTHAHIWDIGLRPIAPLLVRMANGLTPQTRLAIKRDWIALLLDLAIPLCRTDFKLLSGNDEPAEMQYVLTRG